jgi:hypothetical protein
MPSCSSTSRLAKEHGAMAASACGQLADEQRAMAAPPMLNSSWPMPSAFHGAAVQRQAMR